MQLTKLEIKGFKSFGDKATINFDNGITGIVGPNGCGKSNVVDAIRWVLGEQKVKSLRSEKMENIIFNGTKNRKPTQLAEVSLSFKNTKNLLPTEYTNVTITRRYYRSGDSEYQLNGITCRLKDITNLFLDTGIASNSYAIIELGMVDNILNDKDNSRRGLFEEASGISKFKIRKKETMRKLNDTDADLERVEDLLFEIEKNLKSLERQAKQAEKYYKIKEDYKSHSVALAKQKVNLHKEKLNTLKQKLELSNDNKLSLGKQMAEVQATLEAAKVDLVKKEKLLSSRQKALNEHVNKIRSYESEKKIKNERLRFLNDKTDSLIESIEQDRKSSERAAFSISSLTNEKNSLEKILQESSLKLEQIKQDYEEEKLKNNDLKQRGEEVMISFNSKKEKVYQSAKTIEIKHVQLSTLKQELEKATSDSSQQSKNIQDFESKLAQLSIEKNDIQEYFDSIKIKDQEQKNQLQSVQQTVEIIRDEQQQVNRKKDALQNEYNLTKSLVDNLEGFPEAIKFLKKEPKWNKDTPLLSDVLTCPEEYRVAIENYLEPYMNYYIVDTEQEAYQGVKFLSDAAKGKANFFILDKFKNFHASQAGFVQNAIHATEVVEYDAKYKKLIMFILDSVYISNYDNTEGIDQQNAILITKNGKVINRKFSITGGSVGLFEGKRIGRAKNLEKLSQDIKALNVKIQEINKNLLTKTKELDNLKASDYAGQLEIAQSKLTQINEEYLTLKTKEEQFRLILNENTSKKEDVLERITILNEEINDLIPSQEEDQQVLADLEEKYNDYKDEIVELDDRLNRKSTAYNEENILFHQQENKVESLAQEISYKQTNLDTSLERIEKNQSEVKTTEEEVKRMIENSNTNDDQLIEMYAEKEAIELGVTDAEKDYYSQRETIDEQDKKVREIQKSKEISDEELMATQNQLNETKLEMSSVKERLSVEFSIDIDQLLLDKEEENERQQIVDELSEDELIEKVDALKKKLANIGPINPMAMEAYEEIKKRHDFIIEQKHDLITAKDSLMSTIGEIDSAAKENFMEAFEKIKVNFIRVFRSLFTEEDHCDLTLSNPDDPLESSIEIMAKPKGKRPLTINQLSGGEKTLTATSLLFAIYLLKPAPFCIFDEVDAPLDDANIDKFNNIIRDFSNESQFIIVTHNKRSMEATDIIYGVTMVEQGVSRVIPVELKELA